MSIYTGPGFRCRDTVACAFRVYPASGSDADVDEAARIRARHESLCQKKGLITELPRVTDDRAGAIAAALVTLEPTAGKNRCTCRVCGDTFLGNGPRSAYCAKPACQAKRRAA